MMTTKNEFVFSCITGQAVHGRAAGAENDGWRDRPAFSEAESYHDALQYGDLGLELRDEFNECNGEFDPVVVALLLRAAKINEEQNPELKRLELALEEAIDALAKHVVGKKHLKKRLVLWLNM